MYKMLWYINIHYFIFTQTSFFLALFDANSLSVSSKFIEFNKSFSGYNIICVSKFSWVWQVLYSFLIRVNLENALSAEQLATGIVKDILIDIRILENTSSNDWHSNHIYNFSILVASKNGLHNFQ